MVLSVCVRESINYISFVPFWLPMMMISGHSLHQENEKKTLIEIEKEKERVSLWEPSSWSHQTVCIVFLSLSLPLSLHFTLVLWRLMVSRCQRCNWPHGKPFAVPAAPLPRYRVKIILKKVFVCANARVVPAELLPYRSARSTSRAFQSLYNQAMKKVPNE
mgnify:CR=1 FL=1